MGGQCLSLVLFHVLGLQKIIESGPRIFEQNLLVYHILEKEDLKIC